MKKNLLNITGKIMLAVLCMGLLVGCSNDSKESSTGKKPNGTGSNDNEQKEESQGVDLGKKITTTGTVLKDGKLLVIAKNNNKVAVEMEIEVEFYDADGKIVGSDKQQLFAVGPNREIAVQMYDTPDNFDNYKIYADAEKAEESYTTYFDQIEVVHNNNGEEIIVQVKNNSKDVIDEMDVSVVYYQGDKAVGIDYDMESEIKSGRSANFTFYYPEDQNYNEVKFDSYKVFVNEAYTFAWD